MEQIIESIIEKVNFTDSKDLRGLLKKNIKRFNEDKDDVYFGLVNFLQGSFHLTNDSHANKKYEAGILALRTVCDELGIEIEDSECFILFHMRNLGKFKIKEEKLLQELKALWKECPEYAMDAGELTYSLKSLRKLNFVTYRKSVIQLNNGLSVRYRK